MKRLATALMIVFSLFASVVFAEGQDSEMAPSEAETAIVLKDVKAESEIPVLTKVETKSAESTNPFYRLILSLMIISALCVGAIFFTKWWGRNYKTKVDSTRIRVISQHFLGPKKSLAIVRVAGESILIGITDQNISHLRTLSLLEEDSEDAGESDTSLKKDFKSTLKEKSFAIRSEDEFAFGDIQDRITNSGARL